MINIILNEELIQALEEACAGSVAKISDGSYLPLWIHLLDTAGVMEYLVDHWIGEGLLNKFSRITGNVRVTKAWLCFTAGLHDLGKHTPQFQGMIFEKMGFEFNHPYKEGFVYSSNHNLHHSRLGAEILYKIGYPEFIASVVNGHHGEIPAAHSKNQSQMLVFPRAYFGGCSEFENQWLQDWDQIIKQMELVTGFDENYFNLKPSIEDLILAEGLVIMADWIASNVDYFPLISSKEEEKSWSIRRIQEGCQKIDLPRAWRAKKGMESADEFQNRFKFSPNELQRAVMDVANKMSTPGMIIVEAGMGKGKTEAALCAADIFAYKFGCNGLFFGLPTQATANGIFPRVAQWAAGETGEESLSIRLAHSKANLNTDFQSLIKSSDFNINPDGETSQKLVVNEWMLGRKRALLSDFVIGTIDQLLLMSSNSKHAALRHLGAAGKVVILDEIHSFDAYTSKFIDRSLEWLGAHEAPVIILSATLSSQRRTEMLKAYLLGRQKQQKFNDDSLSLSMFERLPNEGYPYIAWTDGDCPYGISLHERIQKQVVLEFIEDEYYQDVIVSRLKDDLVDGGAAGIFVNYVSEAQEMYLKIKESLPNAQILVFHSRFTDEDRARVEKKVLDTVGKETTRAKDDPIIIIGTQVIEQSLDIDFDVIFTQVAPADLVFQRIGRLHRHSNRERAEKLQKPKCYLFDQTEVEHSKIYDRYILNQTVKSFRDTEGKLQIPEDISSVIEKVYSSKLSEKGNNEDCSLFNAWVNCLHKKQNKAEAFLLPQPIKGSRRRETSLAMLNKSGKTNLKSPENIVRDMGDSIDVLLFVKKRNNKVSPVSDLSKEFSLNCSPLENEIPQILKQRVSLPMALTAGEHYEKMEAELNELRESMFGVWRTNGALSNEYFLVLDEDLKAEVGNSVLGYSNEIGLVWERSD